MRWLIGLVSFVVGLSLELSCVVALFVAASGGIWYVRVASDYFYFPDMTWSQTEAFEREKELKGEL